MNIKNCIFGLLLLLFLNSVAVLCYDNLMADERIVIKNKYNIETAYIFCLPNGEIEKIKVYRSTIARGIIVVPFTYTHNDAQFNYIKHKLQRT